jgi:rhodanese-related sulfurtransferase
MLSFLKKLFAGSSVDYKELVNNGAVIIDVRSVGEFKSGHIKGSKNYPLDSLRTKVAELKKLNKPIITVCLSGGRSSAAKSILQSAGLEVYNGGGWASFQRKLL